METSGGDPGPREKDPSSEDAAPQLSGAARRWETSRPRPRAEAGGGGGRLQAAEGRYLVAVAMILLHGGTDSPGGAEQRAGPDPRPRTGLQGEPAWDYDPGRSSRRTRLCVAATLPS